MRVLIVSNWFPPVVSGSSYYSSSLARSLAARGHEVSVVTLDWGPQYVPPSSLPFPVHRLPVIKIPKLRLFYSLELIGAACTPANYRRLKSLVKGSGAQILHQVNHIFDTTFLSISVAHSCGVPIVGSVTTPIQHENRLKHWIMAWADRMTVGRLGIGRWDGVVSLDREVQRYVGRVGGRKAHSRSVVIPYGVRLDSLPFYGDSLRPRSARPQVLMVGHIHPFRNPAQLVRAMPLVLKTVPEARLVLAGRVDLQEPVEVASSLGLTSDQVQFLGPTPHEETIRLMKTSHVFASWGNGPYPGLGTAPLEAMLCQTPVIANDLPENLFGEGRLKDGQNIVLVNSQDPRSVADAINGLLKDEGLRQRIGAAGRRLVLEHLSWESIAAQMEGFYARVLQRRGLRVPGQEPLFV